LADGFAHLSARSRRQRFLAGKHTLSAAELHYLTNVVHHDHEALGAVSLADGRGADVARYIRDRHDAEGPRSPSPSLTSGRTVGSAPNC
jgi:hypothetical protein